MDDFDGSSDGFYSLFDFVRNYLELRPLCGAYYLLARSGECLWLVVK